MPKIKTHSGAKKRFNVTKSGKIKRAHANMTHYFNIKNRKRKRRLRQGTYVDKSNAANIRQLIPYK